MENNHFVTNDLSLAAYLVMRGCELKTAKQLGKTFKFIIDLGDFRAQTLQADFINSEARRFDGAVRDLKKIMFSGG
jgi:hypothetical protein